jgi:hypothetical protein
MDEATWIKGAITLFGILGTAIVTIGGIIIGRLYKSIDLLFAKIGELEKDINVLKLAMMRKADPDDTGIFKAFTKRGK